MNLYELFKKFETEFLAGHEKIKTELDFELFVGKLSEQIITMQFCKTCKTYKYQLTKLIICNMY